MKARQAGGSAKTRARRQRSGVRSVLKSYVNLPAGQIHLRSSPGNGPAIVFLHQTASASSSVHRVMELLSLPNPLIAIDTPGFGESFHPAGWPSMAKYAGYIVDTLDRLKVRRFHLFGHHTGASLAAEIAIRHPGRTQSVMMLGPVPMTAAERKDFRGKYDQPIAPRADGSHMVENWNYAHAHNPNCDLEIVHNEVVNMMRAWKGRAQAYRAVSFHDSLKLIRKLKAPLMFLSSPDDFFYPRFASVCALRPEAKVAIVGGENFPTIVDAAGVAKAIVEFMGALRA